MRCRTSKRRAPERRGLRLGTKKLNDAIDDNRDFSCLPVEMTNLPQKIVKNDRRTAIARPRARARTNGLILRSFA